MSKRLRISPLLCVVVLFTLMAIIVGCKKEEKKEGASELKGEFGPTEEPNAVVSKYLEALEEKDYNKALSCFNAKSKEQLSGPEDQEDFHKFADQIEKIEFTVEEENITGQSATVTISGVMSFIDGSEEATENQVYYLVSEDGEWKIDLTAQATAQKEPVP